MKSYTAKKLFDFNGTANNEVRSVLGEGPTWNANNVGGHRRTLSWVDIKGGKLFLWDTISNRINVIFIVHLQEDQLHVAVNLGPNLLGNVGASSGSGTSATANGMSEAVLVEGKPTIAGEIETIGFAVPVADSEVFLCGSQHGLFYLRTGSINARSVSAHDDKNAHTPFPDARSGCGNNSSKGSLMDSTALQFSASSGAQSAATIRFYTFYVTMEQYIYALPPALSNALPAFQPFKQLGVAGDLVHSGTPDDGCVSSSAVSEGGSATTKSKHGHCHHLTKNGKVNSLTALMTPTSVAAAPHTHRIRFNDAKTDRTGRLFLGTMDNEEKEAIGNLYVLDPEEHVDSGAGSEFCGGNNSAAAVHSHSHHQIHTSFRSLRHALNGQPPTISNGIDWSPCNTRMYYIDSPTRRVDWFRYKPFIDHTKCVTAGNPTAGPTCLSLPSEPTVAPAVRTSKITCENGFSFGLKERQTFFDLNDCLTLAPTNQLPARQSIRGYPDGLTVDANGTVWVALWDGGRVIGINPETQTIVAEVVVPTVSNVTSVCFGGPALSWLIITTATKEGEPDSGHVFVADYLGGAVGLPATEFKGAAFSPPSISAFAAPKSAAPVTIGGGKTQKRKKDNTLYQSKL